MTSTNLKNVRSGWRYKKIIVLSVFLPFLVTTAVLMRLSPGFKLAAAVLPIRGSSISRNKSDNVTIVTAFFNLGTIEKGSTQDLRGLSVYQQWITVYAYIENAVTAYFDDDAMAQLFAKLRMGKQTKIVMVHRHDLWAFSLQNRTQSIFDQPGYPRNPPKSTNAAYVCTMHAKYELLVRTIKEDPFSTMYFAWLDVGMFRDLTGPSENISFGIDVPKCYRAGAIAATKVFATSASSVEEIMRNGIDWVAAGLLLADADTMLSFCKDYIRRAEDLLDQGLANHDQSIILSMYCPSSSWKPAVPLQMFEGKKPNSWFDFAFHLRAEWLAQRSKLVARELEGLQCSYKIFA